MAKLIRDISNDPYSGFRRKVEVDVNNHVYSEDSVTELKLTVRYYTEKGDPVETDPSLNQNNRFDPFPVVLYAGSRLVNPYTGDPAEKIYYNGPLVDGKPTGVVVQEGDESVQSFAYAPGSISDYDFFSGLTPEQLGLKASDSVITIMNAIYSMTIAKKDAEGRFN